MGEAKTLRPLGLMARVSPPGSCWYMAQTRPILAESRRAQKAACQSAWPLEGLVYLVRCLNPHFPQQEGVATPHSPQWG